MPRLLLTIFMEIATKGPLTLAAFIVAFAPWISNSAFENEKVAVGLLIIGLAVIAAGFLIYRIYRLIQDHYDG